MQLFLPIKKKKNLLISTGHIKKSLSMFTGCTKKKKSVNFHWVYQKTKTKNLSMFTGYTKK